MTNAEATARAIAHLEQSSDADYLMSVIRDIAPRARRMSTEAGLKVGDENVPGPADIDAADEAASAEETLSVIHNENDFPRLQALARAAGRRLEELRREN